MYAKPVLWTAVCGSFRYAVCRCEYIKYVDTVQQDSAT
jgi:hypothetical protein